MGNPVADQGGVMTDEVIDHTFNQLMDGTIHAFIARDGDELLGLFHYVIHPVAGCIHPVCYMQVVRHTK